MHSINEKQTNKQKQEASAHGQQVSFEWSKSRNSSTDSKFVQQPSATGEKKLLSSFHLNGHALAF